MNSPLADPLVRACFEHHREYAPPELLGRLLPVKSTRRHVVAKKPTTPAPEPVAEVVVISTPKAIDARARKANNIHFGYPTIDLIMRCVCNFYNVTKTDIVSQRRTLEIVRPRQICVYLAKELTPRSYPAIGRALGNRDHTTALSSFRKITSLLVHDTRMADEIEVIKLRIAQEMAEAKAYDC